ncbi:MAG: FAD:protein FMN transferase [Lachnospiraceae bacterium]|nr:FAD:protein FMN transferase [Lachnospiraceae bacterium]MDD3614856.1 FAD:protein FMN transferase [Lachnospiraceae bacterium]
MKIRILCVVCFLSLSLSACGNNAGADTKTNIENSTGIDTAETVSYGETNEYTQDIFAMDTYMTVTAYGENCQAAVEAAAEEIHRLDDLLSTGNQTSEIALVNENRGGVLGADASYLMERSLDLYAETKGAFDIAIYPIMQEWGFTSGSYQVPEAGRLEQLLTLTDVSKIQFDTENSKIDFGMDGMQIDLGGIAKGYTSTRVLDIFRENGVKSGMVNLGGNVQVLGTKSDGSLWRVAIQSPNEDGSYLGVLSIQDKAVITSGGYERYFEEGGVTYHHIIDPKTGYPADSGLTSVTIVSADGTLADGLSTSFYIMGKDRATGYWREHSDEFDMILLSEEGTVYVTEGISEDFNSEYITEVIRAE